jgi:cytochrome P450
MVARAPYDLTDPRVLLDDAVVADPQAFYDQLRREAPVWQVPGQATFLVSDPGLVREAVGRPAEMSSNLVSLVHRDGRGCPVPFDLVPYGDPMHVLATADPPRHGVHRKLLQPHLSPAAVARLEPQIAALVDELLGGLTVDGTHDAVAELTDPLPARTIAAVIGIPQGEAGEIVRLVAATGALLDGVTEAEGVDDAGRAALQLTALAERHVEAALAVPPADRQGLLAVLAAAIDDRTVSRDEARDIVVQLLGAGTETTASHLATVVERLARDGELQDRLRADPAAIPNLLEATLRDDGPFQFHYRWSTVDLTLGGVEIPAGSRVMLMWAAANRPAPDGSGPDDAAHHLAFGRGLHFCIGAPLARLETRIAVERLLARTSSFTLVPDDPPVRRPGILIRRHRHLPVDLAST